jgi:hypothetical protein
MSVALRIVFESVDSQKLIFGVCLKKTKAILGCCNFVDSK